MFDIYYITERCENILSIIFSSFFQYLICSSSFVVYQFMSVRYLELRDPSMLPCTNIYSIRWHRFHSLEVSIWLWQSLLKGKFSFKIYEFCIPNMGIWCIWDYADIYSYCLYRYVAVCKPHRYRELNIRVGMIRRILIYTIPVATISVLLNIPKFFETKVNTSNVFLY